jgi:hypothetical protein
LALQYATTLLGELAACVGAPAAIRIALQSLFMTRSMLLDSRMRPSTSLARRGGIRPLLMRLACYAAKSDCSRSERRSYFTRSMQLRRHH